MIRDMTLWHCDIWQSIVELPPGSPAKDGFGKQKKRPFKVGKSANSLSWYNFGWKLSTKRKDDNQGARMIIVNLVYRSFASWKVSGETAH